MQYDVGTQSGLLYSGFRVSLPIVVLPFIAVCHYSELIHMRYIFT